MRNVTLLILVSLFLIVGCGKSGDSSTSGTAWEIANPLLSIPTAPLGIQGDLTKLNPAPTSQSVRLGRWLFYDVRLSANNTVSCASCHQSAAGFSSTTATSAGFDGTHGTRKAPPILNLAFATKPFFFWDGRAASLEAQASAPIVNPIEMGMTEAGLIAKLQAIPTYPPYFQEAFQTSTITMDLVTKALAAFEKSRMSGNSTFDQWRAGSLPAYPATAQRGFTLFNQNGCNGCHGGQLFSDFSFHNTGVAWNATSLTFSDLGRSAISGRNADRGAFRTPTLRDVALHGPYMHDGSVATLRDAVVFYNQGGVSNPNLDPAMRPLNLSSDDVDALVSFLGTLNGTGDQDSGPSTFPQ